MVGEQRGLFGDPGRNDLSSPALGDWISECQALGGYWYVKRLSANDTGANGSNQAGPYLSKDVVFKLFPELSRSAEPNPRAPFTAIAGSHAHEATCNAIWYRQRTRDETRITGWGGGASPLLDPDNTGGIALFFFPANGDRRECRYWVCRDGHDEEGAEAFAGPVEPGQHRFWSVDRGIQAEAVADDQHDPCWIDEDQLPERWLQNFPSTLEVFRKAIELAPHNRLSMDERLLRRRECEYSVFRSVEYVELSRIILEGFQTTEDFLVKAQSVLQRRKSRSGYSLQHHVKAILDEENVYHTAQPTVETKNRPDFIFPSVASYADRAFADDRLRMLACKTTVKERWEQVVGEADRIPFKHLFTLQEGVSENQYDKMKERGVCLVVPRSRHSNYPPSVRPELLSLEDFVDEVKQLQQ